MSVFSGYAHFYDIYYADKDYAAEVEFVLGLARQHEATVDTVLDMGCGTGRHLIELVNRGLECDGFDLSEEMLLQARERLVGSPVELTTGDLTTFENGKRYDLVVSMFAVVGYLLENSDLIAGLRTARKHLKPGGLFIFDNWFGPAVLTEKPTERRHEYRNDEETIVRTASPELDPVGQKVRVSYEVTVSRDGKPVRRSEEVHCMRYMFVQEMALALEIAGLKLIHACPFMDPDGTLGTDTWNVTFLARAIP